ncbi:LysR family transcriptional regulator [Vibrio sp. SM6]|uniref:LysR family transcriptional regulator n=1 Tax=Vibrio agarilyticus TaxID=2726741 RepID=A0A7X8TQB7_9VIBR|nr:LysR family transcriptional regulator [Vibrio agarilyticus]NLS12283.1 LysR family transcriptional regulator [Vibrio agarilyticus]
MLLEGIETLLALGQAKTMSRTGSRLYISQSAVSKRIANLEKRLGKKLVEPDGRNVKLTKEAERLIDTLAPSFNQLLGLIDDQQALPDTSTLVLDCSETLIVGYLSPILATLYQGDPHLTITTNHTPRIVERVQSGQATLGICAGQLPPNHGLQVSHLGDEPFFIVSHRPLDSLPSQIQTNDLNNPANSYQLAILTRLGITPVMQMDSYQASAQLALEGLPPALVPLSIVRSLKIAPRHCFSFTELTPLHRPLHICTRPSRARSMRVKTVIATIAHAVAKAISAPSPSTS